jgi:2-polyprenyl-6-hydroxyphenyl methylase/3-demethylubiquinone-9 3-methyltransferase
MQKNNEIDNSIYDRLGERWYTAYDDPVALLRSESKVKAPWVLERIQNQYKDLSTVNHLDVGCGAGFLSNYLAEKNLNVTGLDVSDQSLKVAALYDKTKKVTYVSGDAYKLPFANRSFDSISAMDFLEHIDNPLQSIKEISRVLKPNGLFFFHTFNRNWLANIVIIKMVEKLVKNTPKNMHVIDLFITPKELTDMCNKNHFNVLEMTGIRPQFSTITIKSLFTGTVPENFSFQLTSSLKLSYMGCAAKASD